jgi:hypothetical protein
VLILRQTPLPDGTEIEVRLQIAGKEFSTTANADGSAVLEATKIPEGVQDYTLEWWDLTHDVILGRLSGTIDVQAGTTTEVSPDQAAIDINFDADGDGVTNWDEVRNGRDPTTPNVAPVAAAGSDQTVSVGATVQLDGSESRDEDGDPLTFSWTLTTVPPGSTAMLSDPTGARPTFVADVAGTYLAQLIVNDGTVNSDPDTVTITAPGNTPPEADAGPDQTVSVGATVQLDGSDSSDADDDTLTFSWTLTTVPPGSTTMLSDPTGARPTFVADVAGTYLAQLIVNDEIVDSPPATVAIVAFALLVANRFTDQVTRYNGQTGEFLDVFVAAGSGGLNGPSGLTFTLP